MQQTNVMKRCKTNDHTEEEPDEDPSILEPILNAIDDLHDNWLKPIDCAASDAISSKWKKAGWCITTCIHLVYFLLGVVMAITLNTEQFPGVCNYIYSTLILDLGSLLGFLVSLLFFKIFGGTIGARGAIGILGIMFKFFGALAYHINNSITGIKLIRNLKNRVAVISELSTALKIYSGCCLYIGLFYLIQESKRAYSVLNSYCKSRRRIKNSVVTRNSHRWQGIPQKL